MNFNSLPTEADSILALHWKDYEPYYKELEERTLTRDTIDQCWMTGPRWLQL
jgi:hypothetical protein